MESFEYTITAENGIHARPAGLLVTRARTYPCSITLICKGKTADAKRLISVMGLGAKQGDLLLFRMEGEKDAECKESLISFCKEHL